MDREKKEEKRLDDEAFDILDDGVKAFHAHPFVTVLEGKKEKVNGTGIILTDAE